MSINNVQTKISVFHKFSKNLVQVTLCSLIVVLSTSIPFINVGLELKNQV